MVDAILYFRELATIKGSSGSTYFNPINLPSANKLSFTFADNLLEGIDFNYQNNVLNIPVPISSGLRKINKQDNGLKLITLTINGKFKIPKFNSEAILDTDIAKLKLMSSMLQIDETHPFGKIGFYSPNAPEFTLDPNATSSSSSTIGYTMNSLRIGFMGQKSTRYGFSVTLDYGGTF